MNNHNDNNSNSYFSIFLKTTMLTLFTIGINYIVNKYTIKSKANTILKKHFTDSELEYLDIVSSVNDLNEDWLYHLRFIEKELYTPDVDFLLNENKIHLIVYMKEYKSFCSYIKEFESRDMTYGDRDMYELALLEKLISHYEHNACKNSDNQLILKIDLEKAKIEHPEIFEKFENKSLK